MPELPKKKYPTTAALDGRLLFHGPAGISTQLFGGKMTQKQVDGVERVLRWALDVYDCPFPWAAYILATAYHETGCAMHPVKETQAPGERGISDEEVMRRLDKAYAAGKMKWVKTNYWQDGWFGRGEVQLTHRRNYAKMAPVVAARFPKHDILLKPNLVVDVPDVSTVILVEGMVRGLFTGKKLSDHGNGDPKFLHEHARNIINPGEMDSYVKVSEYSTLFLRAIERSFK